MACNHKFVSLYYQKRGNKGFNELWKIPEKVCNKCFLVQKVTKVYRQEDIKLPQEIEVVFNG